MSYASCYRMKLSEIVKYRDGDASIKNYHQNHALESKGPRRYPLTRDVRLSDLAGRRSSRDMAPRRYRPGSDEVYYDILWFKR